MRKHLSNILLILVFLAGLSLLLYPTVADRWNARVQSRAIASYSEAVGKLDADKYDALWAEARDYERALHEKSDPFQPDETLHEQYLDALDISGSGVMGYIEIPSIKVSLPIYHGTSDAVLQVAVGHIEGSSLPVGGPGTHCALSGHRGLPSAKLFTDLDQMQPGDVFVLAILDQELTYEVDQIRIVDPSDLSGLNLEEGQDYCTLVTCTPYGVNTHRMLVRGHRIENIEEAKKIHVPSDAYLVDTVLVAPVVAAPILLLLLIWLLVSYRDEEKKEVKKREKK